MKTNPHLFRAGRLVNTRHLLRLLMGAALALAGPTRAQVVINEIHCDPPNSKSYPTEFIELYNPGADAVDLSGWAFTRGISYTFPSGTTLAPRGYLVVAAGPTLLERFFATAALGPWLGTLANEGETIELVDNFGAQVDTVSYGSGFPWPTVGDEPERSLQLINEGLDRTLGGSWRSAPPTPGARNSIAADNAPPQIRQVNHDPEQPASAQIVTITAKITDPDGVQSVTLDYQIVEPGNYLPLTNAAFATNWTTLAMRDDGANGDAVANDSVFSLQIPPDVQRHRRLIRYRINASDSSGQTIRVPYADDPSPNFAYFVYDGVPAWTGAVRPGVTATQTFATNITRKVRPYHLLSRAQDVLDCQYNELYNDNIFRFEGALVVEGRVYDHMHYHVRGQNLGFVYASGKNKWKLQFNRGHWFEMPDDYGLTKTTVETLNWSGLSGAEAVWNRGLAGLDEALQYRLSDLAGAPAPRTSYFQLRVIDQATEASATSQYEGDLWGLYLAFETPDNRFKAEHGLPDGNIFRMQGFRGGTNRSHLEGQGASQPADMSDLKAFVSATNGYNTSPTQPESWWRTNVNLLEYFSWRAVGEAVNNCDILDQRNVAYFRDPTDGRWQVMPWDCDVIYFFGELWGPTGLINHNPLEQIRKCLEVPAIQLEFQSRARALQDLLLNTDQAWKLIDELVSLITESGPAQPGFVEVDRRLWDWNPRTTHNNDQPPEQQGNFYRTPLQQDWSLVQRVLPSADFVGQVAFVKTFIASDGYGGTRLANLANDPTIPATPALTYTGDPQFAADGLVLQTTGFSSPTNRAFAAMQWRLGEVYEPNVPNYLQGTPYRYEIEEVWNSGDLTAFNSQMTLPLAFVREGRTYRARVKFQDSGGRWSHWSDPVQFTVGSSGAARLAQSLIVSELMYNPPMRGAVSGDEFEFLELKSIGANTLNLGGLSFTAGINFTFTNGTTLAPSATFLLVRNAAQFGAKYPGVVVNGVYSGKLDNGGETLTLSHPVGGPVLSFTYDDAAPWPVAPDNFDFSLVPVNPNASSDHNNPFNWRASSTVGGSPGSVDPPNTIPSVLISEVLSHSETGGDFIELFNPTTAAVDLGGWFLTDDRDTPMRFRIPPGTLIGPMGYLAFGEAQFNPTPGTNNSFSLNGRGDDVYLFSGDAATTNLTGYAHGFTFGAAADGVTFGRYVISTGEEYFPAQLEPTPGAPNSGPRVGPVVINEIHYHPLPGDDEFIELKNISTEPVPLFDPANPTNTWKLNGAGFMFPTNLTLAAGQTLLLVATNPAAFRARHRIAAAVAILGPYPGQLQDSGERLELQRPDAPDTNGVAFITLDEVRYNDRAPWPFAADGSGASLQRKHSAGYGNDPANWAAADSTPGGDFTSGQAPAILAQPQSRAVSLGQTAAFTVNATGAAPLSYQWGFNGDAIPGAVSSSLVLTGVQFANAGNYSVIVFNASGSAASAIAHLSVATPPLILSQPTLQLVRPGLTAIFRVLAAGNGPLRYQWRKDGAALPGQTASVLTLTNAQLSNNGAYTCVVTDNIGLVSTVPAQLILLIDPLITQNPLSQSVVAGATVVLSVSVTNTATLPIGYRLRRNNSLILLPGGLQVLTQHTAYFALSGTNVAPPWTNYAVVVTNFARAILSASAILTYRTDTDGDGLPDEWEQAFFGNAVAANREADNDGDGMLNWQEYMAGTDPANAQSYLKIEWSTGGGGATVAFGAISNKTYSIQYTDALGLGRWFKLGDVVAQPSNRLESVSDPGYTGARFYRVVTPQQP